MPEIIQKSVLDMVGFDPAGTGQMQLRWRKLTYLDDTLLAHEYHRSDFIEAGDDVEAVYDANLKGLADLGFPVADDAEGRALAKSIAKQRHTPDRIKARAAVVARQQKEAEEFAARQAAELAAAEAARQEEIAKAVKEAMKKAKS